MENNYRSHFQPSGNYTSCHTWVNVALLRRLGFLFEGGVESAGGVGEILCMFLIAGAILLSFAIWQVAVFFVVMLILSIFSGGAAIKFIRLTVFEITSTDVDLSSLKTFIMEQVSSGRFVDVEHPNVELTNDPVIERIVWASRSFRTGVNIALFFATVFVVIELGSYLLTQNWFTNIAGLLFLGLGFLVGVSVLDAGVVIRYLMARSISNTHTSAS